MTNSWLLKMAIFIVSFPIKNGDFHSYVSLPEGNHEKTPTSSCHCLLGWDVSFWAAHLRLRRFARTVESPRLLVDFNIRTTFMSMDWFKGKSTGNHRFSHEIWGFPVNFPINSMIVVICLNQIVWLENLFKTTGSDLGGHAHVDFRPCTAHYITPSITLHRRQ